MIATLALMAAVTTAQDAVHFAHKFVKDDKTAYRMDLSGSEGGGGGEMTVTAEFELTTKETKDGKTPCTVHVTKANASQDGQEIPMDVADLEFTVDGHGAPTSFQMNGLEAVYYIALMTQYLPDAKLKVGDTYAIEVKFGGGVYKGEGKYTGTEELEGKKYAVLTNKTELTPEGQSAGTLDIKHYFDSTSGKIVKTEVQVEVEGGQFKLWLKIKK